MQLALKNYAARGGALLVSGAYIGCDMNSNSEQQFLSNVLKCQYSGHSQTASNTVNGLGTSFTFWKQLNEEHYAATSTDILQPVHPAFTAMQYADGYGAAVAYKDSNYRLFVMGFPFECIQDRQKQGSIMRGILYYLLK
jgi:hypothetical protein